MLTRTARGYFYNVVQPRMASSMASGSSSCVHVMLQAPSAWKATQAWGLSML